MRTVPYFVDTFPSSRRPAYPRQKGELQTDVVIVGGGLTGTACALAFATAGVRVAVIEQDRIGAGATAGSAGLLRQDFDASFQGTASRHGLRAARHLWQSARRASLDFAAALRRFGIRCDLTAQDQIRFTRDGAESARRLKREYQTRRDAGLEATWLNTSALARETAVEASGGIRIKQDTIDPYRACVGLAAAAAARGAAIFERTSVRRVRAGRKAVTVKTASGLVTADAVVIATGAPIDDLRALRRHFVAREAYMVVTDPLPAPVRRQVGKRAASLIDVPSAPDVDFPHTLRWMKDERVLFAGDDQAPTPVRARDKTLTQRAGQLMYELSTWYPAISGTQPAWAWNLVHHESVDGLPVIGLHRNFPRHLFALGHGRHGAGVAWLAARLLVRQFTGEQAKGDELFGFGRIL
jgi:glycine/D-amino acid oxidase-like deaminating enzyme